MMGRQKEIEQEVEKTLQLLRREEDIHVDPFFYTRVQAKITEAERSITSWLVNWKTALLAGLLGLNVITAVFWISNSASLNNNQQLMNSMASEYAFSANYGDWLSASVEE